MEHDHEDDSQEGVYYVIEGRVDVELNDETVTLEPNEPRDRTSASPTAQDVQQCRAAVSIVPECDRSPYPLWVLLHRHMTKWYGTHTRRRRRREPA